MKHASYPLVALAGIGMFLSACADTSSATATVNAPTDTSTNAAGQDSTPTGNGSDTVDHGSQGGSTASPTMGSPGTIP